MSSFEITRVGIPIRTIDITPSFLETIEKIKNSSDCIAITTVDYNGTLETNPEYLSAPAGHDILFNNFKFEIYSDKLKYGVINTFGKIWNVNNGMHRDGPTIVSYLFKFLEEEYKTLKFKHVYMFTQGSPYMFDMFTDYMRRSHALNVIDSRSSIYICAEEMSKVLNNTSYISRNYIPDFIQNKNPVLSPGLNIFPGISNNYNHNTGIPMIQHFFQSLGKLLNSDDMFLFANIDKDDVIVKCITFKEALDNITYFSNPDKILTYGVYKE
jgi:hypothetical protein